MTFLHSTCPMLVDCHTHVFPPKIGPKLAAAIGQEFGRPPAGDGSPEDLLRHLDHAALTHALCFTAALRPEQTVPANTWMIEVGRQHPRLIPFGSVHPLHPGWAGQLDRLRRHGIHGLKIHPDLTGIPLDSPVWRPLWEAAQDDFTCMIHMGPSRPGNPTVSPPRALASVLDNFPRLRVIAAHLGGLHQWSQTLDLLCGRDLDLDTSCCGPFLGEPAVTAILRRHAPDRILFGSDYPLFNPRVERANLATLRSCGLTGERIMDNGARLARNLKNGSIPALPPPSWVDIS